MARSTKSAYEVRRTERRSAPPRVAKRRVTAFAGVTSFRTSGRASLCHPPVSAAGFAEFRPLEQGESPDIYRRNRRIEIKLDQR